MSKSLLYALSFTDNKTNFFDNSSDIHREIEIIRAMSYANGFEYTIRTMQKIADNHDLILEYLEYMESVRDIITEEGLTPSILKFINTTGIIYAIESLGKAMPKLDKSSSRYVCKQQTDMVREAMEWSIDELAKKASKIARILIMRISDFIAKNLKIFKRIQIIVQKTASSLKNIGHIRPESTGKTIHIIEPSRFNEIINAAFKNFGPSGFLVGRDKKE
jgi:hypothetical protein